MNVLNTNKLHRYKDQPMFLGEPLGLSRMDQVKHQTIYKLAEAQKKCIWFPEDIDFSLDKSTYKTMTEQEQWVFCSNLKFQTAGDAMLSRGIDELKKYASLPEVERCFAWWSVFENAIHSDSYTHIFKGTFSNETEFWDSIFEEQEIVDRVMFVKEAYDKLLTDDTTDIKEKIFNSLVVTNVVEGLSFYVSFAVSFFFGSVSKKCIGNSNVIKLIERDERLHAAITTYILKQFRDNPDEGFQDIYRANEHKIYEAFRIATEQEENWADYLFKYGPILGLSAEQLKLFAQYKCNERLKLLGLTNLYPKQKSNPLGSFYDNILDSKSKQTARQEDSETSYLFNIRNTHVDMDVIRSIKL